MCSPMAAAAISAIATATSTIATTVQERKNAKYNTQIAKTNAKIAYLQGKQEEQEGIEAARTEKIKGIKAANLINAQNASSNFDIKTDTNLFNFQDALFEGESQAKSTQDNYNLRAKNYYLQAGRYLNQNQNTISNYNSKILNTALGRTNKVASSWLQYSMNSNSGGII